MRVVIALKPHGDPAWVVESVGRLPLAHPLDIVVVSALDIPRPPLTSPGPVARRLYHGAMAGLRRDAQQGAETMVQALRPALWPRAASVAVRVVDGRPVPVILHSARSWNADLILMGSGGQNALSRAILGSVAESVVRLAPCLVLSVPAALSEQAAPPIAADATLPVSRPCLVCGRTSDDLVCEMCRTRIRAEALHEKQEAERPGHRGLPV